MARRKAAPAKPVPPPCQPTGDMRPWADPRPRTCTLCAQFVVEASNHDGTDWIARDALGMAWEMGPVPELCPCYPPDSELRTRGGTLIESARNRGPDVECDEKPRHYGPGLYLDATFRSHMHNALGGEVYYSDVRGSHWACGHREPPTPRTMHIEPWPDRPEPPQCCGQPMRFAPRGWACRVTDQFFVPDFEGVTGG